MRRQDPYADIALPIQTGDPYADIAAPIPTNRNRRQTPPPSGAAPQQDEEGAPFQPELTPGDNAIYPTMRPGFEAVGTPQHEMDPAEATANARSFGAQGTSRDPIDLAKLPPEDRAYLNGGMYVRLPNGDVHRLMADARPNAGGEGAEQIAPGLFLEAQSTVPEDIAKSFPTGVVEGLTGMAGVPGVLAEMVGRDNIKGPASVLAQIWPTGEQLNEGIRGQIGYDYYQPQTVAGEYSRTAGEFLPGVIAPGSTGAKLASWLVPAATSETSGQLARMLQGGQRDTTAEGIARFAGALGGGLGVGATNAVRGGADISLRNAAQGVTPQQLEMARILSQDAEAMGINMTRANALQQVTGGGTGLGQLQRAVEGSSPRLQAYFAQLPEQITRAGQRQLDQIGPNVPPSDLAGQARTAANSVLERTRARINAEARPFYGAADDQVVSAEEYAALREIPTYREAEAAFYGNPELSGGAAGPQSIGSINRVIQEMDTLARQADPGNMAPNANASLARVRGESADLAKGLVDMVSPEYAQARAIGAAGRQGELAPLQRGPIGSIAAQSELQPSLPATTNRLFPAQPFEGQAAETAQALSLMGDVDPSVGGALVRQHLSRQFMESMQDASGGPNQFGGADFAARVFGNPEQRRTVMGAIDATAPRVDPDMAFPEINPNAQRSMPSDPMARFVDVLQATGQRHKGGSQTAFIQEIQQQLRGGNLATGAAQTLANPPGVLGRVGRGIDDWTARRNAETLAELLMANSDEFNARLTRAINRPRGANRIRAGVTLGAGQED